MQTTSPIGLASRYAANAPRSQSHATVIVHFIGGALALAVGLVTARIDAAPSWYAHDGLIVKRIVARQPGPTVERVAGARRLAQPVVRGLLNQDMQLIFEVLPAPEGRLLDIQRPMIAWFKLGAKRSGLLSALPRRSPRAAGWDEAHRYLDEASEFAERGELLDVEPDFIAVDQSEPSRPQRARAVAKATDSLVVFGGQNLDWPYGAMDWHLDADHSQLRDAALEIEKGQFEPATIAILDIGFLPRHLAFPASAMTAVEIADPDRTPDHGGLGEPWYPSASSFNGVEHGTATAVLLAGRRLDLITVGGGSRVQFAGGNPHARVLPLRVGASVVAVGLPLRTFTKQSDIAAGFGTAVQAGANVISMSIGGLPSGAEADAVETAESAGIPMFCATGDFKVLLTEPVVTTPKYLVFPAAYRPVMAVAGVTYGNASYGELPGNVSLDHDIMFGSCGPADKMANAIAGWTPNVPWVRIPDGPASSPNDPWNRSGDWNQMDLDGAGTSASTPQAAATASLIIEKNHAALCDSKRFPEAWQRAEAVYWIIRNSAQQPKTGPDPYHFGAGFLRAQEALKQSVPTLSDLPVDRPRAESSLLYVLEIILSSLSSKPIAATTPPTVHRQIAVQLQKIAQTQNPHDQHKIGYFEAQANLFEAELEQDLASSYRLQQRFQAVAHGAASRASRLALLDDLRRAGDISRKTSALLDFIRREVEYGTD